MILDVAEWNHDSLLCPLGPAITETSGAKQTGPTGEVAAPDVLQINKYVR